MFFETGVLKSFAIFIGKHLRWSLFLIKLQAWRPSILLKKDFQHWHFPENIANAVSKCTVAVYYTFKYYMHGSLFFSKNAALCQILECYMHSSWIQFVVFKLLSFCFKEAIGFDK